MDAADRPEVAYAMYHHQCTKERAIGIEHETAALAELRHYFTQQLQAESGRLLLSLALQRAIAQGRDRIKEIVAEAPAAEDKYTLLAEAEAIQERLELAGAMIEALNGD